MTTIRSQLTTLSAPLGDELVSFEYALMNVRLRKPFGPKGKMIEGRAVIDTAAHLSAIRLDVAQELDLPLHGQVTMSTAQGPGDFSRAHISYALPGCAFADTTVLVGSQMLQEIEMIIGTDILSSCVFEYNGQEKCFTLHF